MLKPTRSGWNLVSVLILLQLIFAILRLTNVIEWHILWVLSPLWMPWVLLAFSYFYIKLFAMLIYGINPEEEI